ncbi:MAG: HAMP domain-containing protein, partial [Rhodopseudomonas sp.]|nr:HAMP domain-containing protein [Rhodopseudomonas sp.]
MFRLSNIGIGLKLGIMSGLGVLLVAAMIAAAMYGSSYVKGSSEEALLQQGIQTDLARIELGFSNAMLTVRNIRLADTKEKLDAANNLPGIKRDADSFIEALKNKVVSAESDAKLDKVKAYLDQFVDTALKEIVPLQLKLQAYDTSAYAQIADLTTKMDKIQSTRMEVDNKAGMALVKDMADGAAKASAAEALNAKQAMRSSSQVNLAVGVAVILILIASAFVGASTIARPLKALVAPLEQVAGGNFAIHVPGVGRMDEVGQIAGAVALMAEKVSASIGGIKASGREVTNASAEISTSTSDLSQRTEEQAASLEETSAAMEELAATVRKNAENAQVANQSASSTRDVADRGGKVVAQAVQAMAKIEDSSRKISDIIGVIDEIARQTNL